jgi:hypothetical protein
MEVCSLGRFGGRFTLFIAGTPENTFEKGEIP